MGGEKFLIPGSGPVIRYAGIENNDSNSFIIKNFSVSNQGSVIAFWHINC